MRVAQLASRAMKQRDQYSHSDRVVSLTNLSIPHDIPSSI